MAIAAASKQNTLKIFPNAIKVALKGDQGELLFVSFLKRDACFKIIAERQKAAGQPDEEAML